jgi:hypothetical protein
MSFRFSPEYKGAALFEITDRFVVRGGGGGAILARNLVLPKTLPRKNQQLIFKLCLCYRCLLVWARLICQGLGRDCQGTVTAETLLSIYRTGYSSTANPAHDGRLLEYWAQLTSSWVNSIFGGWEVFTLIDLIHLFRRSSTAVALDAFCPDWECWCIEYVTCPMMCWKCGCAGSSLSMSECMANSVRAFHGGW